MPLIIFPRQFFIKNVRSWVFSNLCLYTRGKSKILQLRLVANLASWIYSFPSQLPFIAQCCHPCNYSSIHVFTFIEDEMNNLSFTIRGWIFHHIWGMNNLRHWNVWTDQNMVLLQDLGFFGIANYFYLQHLYLLQCKDLYLYQTCLDLKRQTYYRQKLHLCSSQSRSRFLEYAVIGEYCEMI